MERLVASKPDKSLCARCLVAKGGGRLNLCKGMKDEIVFANCMVEGGKVIQIADEVNPDDNAARETIGTYGLCEPLLQQIGHSSTDAATTKPITADRLGDLESVD